MAEPIAINNISGLSEAEAAQKLQEEGYNEIPSAKKRSILAITFDVVKGTNVPNSGNLWSYLLNIR